MNFLRYPLKIHSTCKQKQVCHFCRASLLFKHLSAIAWRAVSLENADKSWITNIFRLSWQTASHQGTKPPSEGNISIPGPHHWDKTQLGKALTDQQLGQAILPAPLGHQTRLTLRSHSHSGTHHHNIGQVSRDKSIHTSRGAHHRCPHVSHWHCQGPWGKQQGFVTIAHQINTLSPTLHPC